MINMWLAINGQDQCPKTTTLGDSSRPTKPDGNPRLIAGDAYLAGVDQVPKWDRSSTTHTLVAVATTGKDHNGG